MYKDLWLLNVQINYCTSKIFWPGCLSFYTLTHILGNVATIKFHGVIPWPGYGVFPFISFNWLIVEFATYPLLGQLYKFSNDFLQNWKERLGMGARGKEGRRQIQALQPFGLYISSAFIVTRTTVLVILSIIINLTVTFLLLF